MLGSVPKGILEGHRSLYGLAREALGQGVHYRVQGDCVVHHLGV